MFVEENEGYGIYHLMLKAVMIETARKLITNDYKTKDYKNDKTEAARLYALMRGIQLQCLHPYSMRINEVNKCAICGMPISFITMG